MPNQQTTIIPSGNIALAMLRTYWWLLLLVVLFFANIYLPDFPPRAGCASEHCIEGREWFSVLLTILAVLGGFFQYTVAQKWKRAEWIANETATFLSDPSVMNALKMLDWNRRRFPLLPEDARPSSATFLFTADLLNTALYSIKTIPKDPETGKDRPFTPPERAVRDYFDRMLDGLVRFEIFLQQGLISFEGLRPYLEYWIRLIADDKYGRKSTEQIRMLWQYIEDYDFKRVQVLCERFGYDIRKHLIGPESALPADGPGTPPPTPIDTFPLPSG